MAEPQQPDTEPRDDWSLLMVRGQDGDQAAYRQLLKSVTPYLRALARRAGLPPDDCEDGVQDVLMTIHAIRHTYDPARPFTPMACWRRPQSLGRQAAQPGPHLGAGNGIDGGT